MNPSRVIYEDAPAFIPVPAHLQHKRLEAIFWPLDEPGVVSQAPSNKVTSTEVSPASPVPLSQLIGKAKGCFEDAAAVDQFIRAGRDEWER